MIASAGPGIIVKFSGNAAKPGKVADIVTVIGCATGLACTVNDAVVPPAGMVTPGGIVTAAGLSADRATVIPPR